MRENNEKKRIRCKSYNKQDILWDTRHREDSHNIPMGKWEPMICDWKTNDFKEYRKAVDYEVIGNIFDNPQLLEV